MELFTAIKNDEAIRSFISYNNEFADILLIDMMCCIILN